MPINVPHYPDVASYRHDPAGRRPFLSAGQLAGRCATGICWPPPPFVIAALTDWFDGWLARKWNQTSAFGAFLDPVADKLDGQCRADGAAGPAGRVDAFIALIIIGREITISALREWMAQIGASASVAVHRLGKFKTAAQMVAVPCLLYYQPVYGVSTQVLGNILILVAAVLDGMVDAVLPAARLAGHPRKSL